ncbi:hypothetical protein BEWA_036040 [Theileria equi strain WA]|uniref:Uncharacterized protein n=1 Tax=Theileria equi strain WA TaxID=1537102 RepID=L1LEG7_THEEQ|nr:hypothetical protein BEWA_036040 [Theileria equi strain WA]EKX73568.1 hypothetical protein BEWA_036040 [Theileria equi strain WA]|eukprot:XP_004833020.1 hypothetical protein BEWA_036040 [Theileria equi strain WA]
MNASKRRDLYKPVNLDSSFVRKSMLTNHRQSERSRLLEASRQSGYDGKVLSFKNLNELLSELKKSIDSNSADATIAILGQLLGILKFDLGESEGAGVELLAQCLSSNNHQIVHLAISCILEIVDNNPGTVISQEYIAKLAAIFESCTKLVPTSADQIFVNILDSVLNLFIMSGFNNFDLITPYVSSIVDHGVKLLQQTKPSLFVKTFSAFLCVILESNTAGTQFHDMFAHYRCLDILIQIIKENYSNINKSFVSTERTMLGDILYAIFYFISSSYNTTYEDYQNVVYIVQTFLTGLEGVNIQRESFIPVDEFIVKMDSTFADVLIPLLQIISQCTTCKYPDIVNSSISIPNLQNILRNCFKSPHRSVKLVSLYLCTIMAEGSDQVIEFTIALIPDIIEILKSEENYDIRLESGVCIVSIYRNALYRKRLDAFKFQILDGFLKLFIQCKHDYTTVMVSLDYFELFLNIEPTAIEMLYEKNIIEILESAEFLHDDSVRLRISKFVENFDTIEPEDS